MKLWLLACLALLLFSPGCDKDEENSRIIKEVVKGNRRAMLTIDPSSVSLAGEFLLKLDVWYGEEETVTFPEIKIDFAGMRASEDKRTSPELAGEKQLRVSGSWILEPVAPGKHTIPPLTVKISTGTSTTELITEKVTVEVIQFFKEKGRQEIKDETEPKEIPWRPGIWSLVAVLLLLAMGGGLFLLKYRRPSARVEKVTITPPHIVALGRLARLLKKDLVARGKVKLFHQEISDILRHYIEDRFRLKAPEQTTEEFLAELQTSTVLSENHKSLLQNFLHQCDLVKFAKHEPGREDCDATTVACEGFINETAEETPGGREGAA